MTAKLDLYVGAGVLPEDLAPVAVHQRGWDLPDGRPGIQALWRFPNRYGASVILNAHSYGVELAVIRWHDEGGRGGWDYGIDYGTPITDDVLGRLSPVELVDALRRIRDLPEPHPELGAGRG